MLGPVVALLAGGCSLEAAMLEKLDGLTRAEQRQDYRVAAVEDGSVLRMWLLDGDKVVLRFRELPATATCDESAMVLAVVAAAWMDERPTRADAEGVEFPAPPEVSIALPRRAPREATPRPAPPPRRRAPVSAAVPAPAEAPAPVAAALPAAPVTDEVAAPEEAAVVVEPRGGWLWGVTLAAGAAWASNLQPSVGLRFDGGRTFGFVVEAAHDFERQIAVGAFHSVWSRSRLGLGARVRLDSGEWSFEPVSLTAVIALVEAHGLDFAENRQGLGVEAGACLGARATRVLIGPLVGFAGLGACVWPRPSQQLVDGSTDSASLPMWDVTLSAGLGWSSAHG